MPELPEVEVTRRRIAPLLVGRTIARVHTTPDSYVFVTKPALLKRKLVGRSVQDLARAGKYLVAELDDTSRFVLHLGMTGQLFATGVASVRLLSATTRSALSPEQTRAAFEPDMHTHLRLSFADEGRDVMFRDVRKFGKLEWLAPGASSARLDKLGIDALVAKGEHLYRLTRRRRAAIKTVLLDQRVLAGVGNIYADEALFSARVHPRRAAHRLSQPQCAALVSALQRVMLRSVQTGGSTIRDFMAPDGADGGYQDERTVYGRTGEPCPVCGRAIVRVVLSQRATHYCPRCQRSA